MKKYDQHNYANNNETT